MSALDELPSSYAAHLIDQAVRERIRKEEPMSCCENKPESIRSIYRGIVYDRNADEIVVDDTYISDSHRQVEVLLGIDLHEYAKEQSIAYDLADYDFVIQHIGDVRPKAK